MARIDEGLGPHGRAVVDHDAHQVQHEAKAHDAEPGDGPVQAGEAGQARVGATLEEIGDVAVGHQRRPMEERTAHEEGDAADAVMGHVDPGASREASGKDAAHHGCDQQDHAETVPTDPVRRRDSADSYGPGDGRTDLRARSLFGQRPGGSHHDRSRGTPQRPVVGADRRAPLGAASARRRTPMCGVVVLTGAGERAFCAGADLDGWPTAPSFADLHDGRGELAELFRDLCDLGKPTIARVRGFALAGGFGLALACDLVVAADDAVFGTPEIDVGLWPHMITVPLIRSMAPKRALELMLTGRRVDADRGGAARVRHPGGARRPSSMPTVDELAAALAAKSPTAHATRAATASTPCGTRSVDASLRLLHPLLTITASHRRRRRGHRRLPGEAPAGVARALSSISRWCRPAR